MKIIAKESGERLWIYHISNGELICRDKMLYLDTIDTKNTKDVHDFDILYHYVVGGIHIPVYYEYNNKAIAYYHGKFNVMTIQDNYIKDYTLVNLKLLENEGDI